MMRLEIATPHDRVVEVRVDGPPDDDSGSLIGWTLAAVPTSSAVVLDLRGVDQVDDALAGSVDDAIRDLDRRHIPVVLVTRSSGPGASRRATWLAAGAAMVLSDVAAARHGAVELVDATRAS